MKNTIKNAIKNYIIITIESMVVLFIVVAIICILIPPKDAFAAKPSKWEEKIKGTVVDIDPMVSGSGEFGILVEFDCGDHYDWTGFCRNYLNLEGKGKWPNRGEKGTLFTRREGDKSHYKWILDETSKKKKAVKKKVVEKKLVPTSLLTWTYPHIKLPTPDRTVLVRYKNGKTITTAYINHREEWKLETSRDVYRGGKNIKTIDKWSYIPK